MSQWVDDRCARDARNRTSKITMLGVKFLYMPYVFPKLHVLSPMTAVFVHLLSEYFDTVGLLSG